MQLYNKLDRKILKERLMQEPFQRTTLSFYRYVRLSNPEALRDELYLQWDRLQVLGRIYVAREGINAQLSVPHHHLDAFRKTVDSHAVFRDVPFKIAVEDDGKSFYKLSIKVRPKLVNEGLDDDAYDVSNVGNHLDADRFNEAIADPDTIVVDMRNYYEFEIGHFERAVRPEGVTFREVLPEMVEKLKDARDKKIILYCTGGIRCEKASAYFRHHGFKDVNQLHGGIIDYARQIKVKQLDNAFLGSNFVFDNRLGEHISNDVISHCYQCGKAADKHSNCRNEACHVLFIQCEECAEKYEGCCGEECQSFLHMSEEEKQQKAEEIQRIREESKYFNKDKEVLRKKFKYFEV